MGISTVAVFSDADEGAPFVRSADRAVRIGPASSAESYLRIDKIVDAAKRTRANAIHPGFGFLAENAELAEACASAGITFVGPSPRAIRDMGLKREAKAIVAKAGVPVIPVMSTGATDGAHTRNAGIPTYGVSGLFSDIDDKRAHGKDERINVKAYYEGQEFLYQLTKELTQPIKVGAKR